MEDSETITVLITSIERLTKILNHFSPNLECIDPLTIEEVADQYATLVELMEPPEDFKELGDFGVLVLQNGQDIVLPVLAFDPINMTIEEILEESREIKQYQSRNMKQSYSIGSQDAQLAFNLATECIQRAFR
jgi:hypothetical protein